MILPGIKPNVLNNFESYNYNIQLIMFEEDAVKEPGPPPPDIEGIVIAETGRTGQFYIDRLEFKSIGAGIGNNISRAINFKMNIVEPMGFSFFDRYFSSAIELGWNSLTKVPIFLKIWFSGWSESGAANPDIVGTQYWRVDVINIETDVQKSGSTYSIEMIPKDESALDSIFAKVPRSFTFEKQETLEETLEKFSEKLTEVFSEDQETENAISALTEYKIQLDDQFIEEELKMRIDYEVGDDASDTDNEDRSMIHVSEGDTIEKVIEKIVLDAKGISEFLSPNLKEDSETEPDENNGSVELAKYFAIQEEVVLGEYVKEVNDYDRTLVYYINRVFRPDREIISPEDGDDLERLKRHIQDGLLVKRYDFTFTGDNTEIIDFNMNFKNFFWQLLPAYTHRDTRYPRATSVEDDGYSNSLPEQRRLTVNIEEDDGDDEEDDGKEDKFSFPLPIFGQRYMEDRPVFKNIRDLISFRVTSTGTKSDLEKGTGRRSSRSADQEMNAAALASDTSNTNKTDLPEFSRVIDLLSIEIEIRGDPYWFGTPEALNNPLDPRENNFIDRANFENGDVYFLLKFSTPEPFSEGTGLIPNRGRITFTGLYRVTTLINTFENGVFKQKLEGLFNFTTVVPDDKIEKVIDLFNMTVSDSPDDLGQNNDEIDQ